MNKISPLPFSTSTNIELEKIKSELSQVSTSFCLAKWLQVTLHLHKGTTHSCHHPPVHAISAEEISRHPSSLHNTQIKINERQQMLQGQQLSSCDYCWNIEKSDPRAISDRVTKSAADWAYPYIKEVIASGLGENINPRYLEVSFSNTCNFKCSYCSADYSSKWQQELEQFGSYSTQNGGLTSPFYEEASNPFIKAFWNWWPYLKEDLKIFRITGGEPLLSKNTWRLFDEINARPLPHLQLAINSNLAVPTEIIYRLIRKLKTLLAENKVGEIRIFASIDGIGKDAELIRHGLDSELFFKHLDLLLQEIPQMRVVIMATYGALSVFSYTDLLKRILDLRKKYINPSRPQPLGIDTNYLRHPEHLSVKILPPVKFSLAQESLSFMESNRHEPNYFPEGFNDPEINSVKNLLAWMKIPIDPAKKILLQNKFRTFYQEHDKRRGTESLSRVELTLQE